MTVETMRVYHVCGTPMVINKKDYDPQVHRLVEEVAPTPVDPEPKPMPKPQAADPVLTIPVVPAAVAPPVVARKRAVVVQVVPPTPSTETPST